MSCALKVVTTTHTYQNLGNDYLWHSILQDGEAEPLFPKSCLWFSDTNVFTNRSCSVCHLQCCQLQHSTLPDPLDIGVSTKYYFTSLPLVTALHSAYAPLLEKFLNETLLQITYPLRAFSFCVPDILWKSPLYTLLPPPPHPPGFLSTTGTPPSRMTTCSAQVLKLSTTTATGRGTVG